MLQADACSIACSFGKASSRSGHVSCDYCSRRSDDRKSKVHPGLWTWELRTKDRLNPSLFSIYSLGNSLAFALNLSLGTNYHIISYNHMLAGLGTELGLSRLKGWVWRNQPGL